MAINVTIGESKTQEKPFPKLMICKSIGGNTIILANEKSDPFLVGTCIYSDYSENRVGEYFEQWSLSAFTDYNEPITLQNQ